MPINCEADDQLGRVAFDLQFEGGTWRASVSYETLSRMFAAPRCDASTQDARESRQQLVCNSKAIARIVAERIRAGAAMPGPIVIA
ncbi:MAG TPA: hypothetical protein VH040_11120 [Usitatibacter sp.]|jgi:hypothetical protein|nr:hypothetical protein [Usitatibacter sp.]